MITAYLARAARRVREDTREEFATTPVRDTVVWVVELVSMWGIVNRVFAWLVVGRVIYTIRYSDRDVDYREYHVEYGRPPPLVDAPPVELSTSLVERPVQFPDQGWRTDAAMHAFTLVWAVVGYLSVSGIPHMAVPFIQEVIVVQYLVVVLDPVWTALAAD